MKHENFNWSEQLEYPKAIASPHPKMTINITSLSHNSEHLTHPKYRADIDGLRAIAVLSVVGFHAFPFWVRGGFIGVDIFFVISGFLISTIIFGSLERNSFSFVEFYSRRIKRIFPALLFVLIASFALGWFTLLADEYKQLGKHIAGGAGFISNILLWNESNYFDKAAETKPLLHLWSLGIEEQYYLIWPLLLWFVWKLRLNFLSITIAVATISFALNIGYMLSDAVAAFYSPQTRFWELMAGSVLAHMTLHRQNIGSMFKNTIDTWISRTTYAQTVDANGNWLRNAQSVLGATLIAIGVFVITKERHFPGWWAVMPTLGAALIISAGAQAWLNRVVLSHRVLVWFGLISYPLYLWHWPLLSFTRIVESEPPSSEIRIAVVLISVVLAWLTYRLVEKPIRFGSHSKAKAITLLTLMIIVGYVGYNCYRRDGLGFRLPKITQELAQVKNDFSKEYQQGSCFLNPEQDYTAFDLCESSRGQRTSSILIWGDSHAAHLYPGYKASFGESFKLIQRTASMCPPIIDMEIDSRPHCKKINDYILETIKKEKPVKIVLAAAWENYDWKKLDGTITKLRQIGITNIDLIGPVPQWVDSLPQQLFLYQKFRSDKPLQIPERMNLGLNQNFIQLDPIMFDFAKQLNVNYISPRNILCNESGCLTNVPASGNSLITWDYAHLTGAGSRYLVSQFPK